MASGSTFSVIGADVTITGNISGNMIFMRISSNDISWVMDTVCAPSGTFGAHDHEAGAIRDARIAYGSASEVGTWWAGEWDTVISTP